MFDKTFKQANTLPEQGRSMHHKVEFLHALLLSVRKLFFYRAGFSLSGKLGNFVDGHGKLMCIVRVAGLLFVFVGKKMKNKTFSACYNKMVTFTIVHSCSWINYITLMTLAACEHVEMTVCN